MAGPTAKTEGVGDLYSNFCGDRVFASDRRHFCPEYIDRDLLCASCGQYSPGMIDNAESDADHPF